MSLAGSLPSPGSEDTQATAAVHHPGRVFMWTTAAVGGMGDSLSQVAWPSSGFLQFILFSPLLLLTTSLYSALYSLSLSFPLGSSLHFYI